MVHESATDLHDAGVMDQTTKRESDGLYLPPDKQYTAVQIKKCLTQTPGSGRTQGHRGAGLITNMVAIDEIGQT